MDSGTGILHTSNRISFLAHSRCYSGPHTTRQPSSKATSYALVFLRTMITKHKFLVVPLYFATRILFAKHTLSWPWKPLSRVQEGVAHHTRARAPPTRIVTKGMPPLSLCQPKRLAR
jgi:hypothetical protein